MITYLYCSFTNTDFLEFKEAPTFSCTRFLASQEDEKTTRESLSIRVIGACQMSRICYVLHGLKDSTVKCLSWYLGHAEQLLFSCLCSKLTVYRWTWRCFWDHVHITPHPLTFDIRVHRAGSQLKIQMLLTAAGNQSVCVFWYLGHAEKL